MSMTFIKMMATTIQEHNPYWKVVLDQSEKCDEISGKIMCTEFLCVFQGPPKPFIMKTHPRFAKGLHPNIHFDANVQSVNKHIITQNGFVQIMVPLLFYLSNPVYIWQFSRIYMTVRIPQIHPTKFWHKIDHHMILLIILSLQFYGAVNMWC